MKEAIIASNDEGIDGKKLQIQFISWAQQKI
jgi:hypothetical protein